MELISKTSGNGGENQIQNPKAFIFVAFDTLIVAKDRDSIRETVVIYVNETGAKEGDCSVNVDVWEVDVDGKGSGDAVCNCGKQSFRGEDSGKLIDVLCGDYVAKA
jgi:hypothetical protein